MTTLPGLRLPAQRRTGGDDGWRARARTHKVQVRPIVASAHWFWTCLTCGPASRSSADYPSHDAASAAACDHDAEVDLLR